MKPSIKTVTSVLLAGLIFIPQNIYSQDTYDFDNSPKASTDSEAEILKKIFQSLVNFGASFGFKINPDEQNDQNYSNPMPDLQRFKKIQMSIVKDLFYVISRNNNFQTLFADDSTYAAFDKLSTNLFSTYPMVYTYLDSPSSSSSSNSLQAQDSSNTVSPITQAVLNILNYTPWDVCINYSNVTNLFYQKDTDYKYLDSQIIYNSIFNTQLTSPKGYTINCSTINDLSDSTKNDNIIKKGVYFNPPGYSDTTGQTKPNYENLSTKLDSSVLLSPLIYSADGDAENDQLKNAQAFVRYITGSVLPPQGPSALIMSKMINTIKTSTDPSIAMSYFNTLGNYILSTRIYAARQSVPIRNIYEILSRRMPIPNSSGDQGGSPNEKTSQALNEFNMASYRLFAPSNSNNNLDGQQGSTSTSTWQDMINTASSSVIQKETALLLAEINYQLYLMRVQQEKLLLTNSLFLINNVGYPTLRSPDPD